MATTTPRDSIEPKAAARRTRDARVRELSADGLSERQIAKRLGMSRSNVWRILQEAK